MGWSSGIVYSCRNTGAVGYPHVGYNVGGIAGRQDGHLSGCTNRGEVYGRKDVGGIVGQAEPDVALSPDSGALDRLRRELDVLEDLIGRTLDRAGEDGDGISARLSGIGRTAGEARDHTEDLLDHVSDFVDGNVGSVNSLSAAVTKALDDTVPALEELSDVSGRMEGLARRLEDALDALGDTADGGADVSADAGRAAGIFRRAGRPCRRRSGTSGRRRTPCAAPSWSGIRRPWRPQRRTWPRPWRGSAPPWNRPGRRRTRSGRPWGPSPPWRTSGRSCADR